MAIITGTGNGSGGGTNPTDPNLEPSEHGGSGLFVYDVKSVTSGKNILVNRQPSIKGEFTSVVSAATDDTEVDVYICWDRNEKAAVGLPSVNGVVVDSVVNGTQADAISSPTFTAIKRVSVADGNIIVSYDDAIITIPMSTAQTPVISNFTVDQTYPTGQTELKKGDPIFISFDVDIPIKAIEVTAASGNAAAAKTVSVVGSDLSFTAKEFVTNTIGDFASLGTDLTVTIRVQSKENAWSAATASTNTIHCNDQHPVITWNGVTYPGGRGALKGSEQAIVGLTLSHTDTTVLTSSADLGTSTVSPTSDFSVTRVGGDYVYKTDNLTLTAGRVANGSSTVSKEQINISNVAPTLTVTETPSKLRAGEANTVAVVSTQVLSAAPTLKGDLGTPMTGGVNGITHTADATTFPASITMADNESGLGEGTWTEISGTSLSGLVASNVTGDNKYNIVGYARKEVIKPAFANQITIPVYTTNVANVRVHWLAADGTQLPNTPAGGLLVQSQSSAVGDIVVNGYRVDVNPANRTTTITILDKSKVESISKDSIVRIEEL